MKIDKHLKDISEIRTLMERSAKFLSLSGMSGIAVGAIGLLAAGTAHLYLRNNGIEFRALTMQQLPEDLVLTLSLLAIATLVTAVGLAVLFSTRMAKRQGLPVWSPTTKYLLTHFFTPLLTGGFICVVFLYHGLTSIIPSMMLIFYGLALFSASTFTVREIRNLGLAEMILGFFAALWVQHALACWAIGFGVLHIVNGIVMYLRYER